MRFNIGLGGWILGDGNYPGFRSGDEAKFALEFSDQEGFVPTGHSGPSLEPLHEITPIYETSGTVVYIAPKVWVCDFGLLAYREVSSPPDWARVGVTFTGSVYLGVDPFDYKERLHKLPGMPRLTYRVAVGRIFRNTTPLIEKSSTPPVLMRDPARVSYEEVEATGTPLDNRRRGTSGDFVLECDVLEAGLAPLAYRRRSPWREAPPQADT